MSRPCLMWLHATAECARKSQPPVWACHSYWWQDITPIVPVWAWHSILWRETFDYCASMCQRVTDTCALMSTCYNYKCQDVTVTFVSMSQQFVSTSHSYCTCVSMSQLPIYCKVVTATWVSLSQIPIHASHSYLGHHVTATCDSTSQLPV